MNRLCLITICTIALSLHWLSAFPQSSQPVFTQLTTDDGLSFNAVYSILQDNDGFMWFGTMNGIDRYDGVEIVNYRSKDIGGFHIVFSMTLDSLGNLWHGCILHKYDPRTDKKQRNYFYVDSVARWASWFWYMTIGPDNKLYLTGNDRIYTRDLYSPDSVVYEILFVEDHHNLKDLTKLQCDNNDNMWVGTDKGLFIYDIPKNELVPFDRIHYPEQRLIKDFLFGENGDLWIAFNDQVTVYNFVENKSTTYTLQGTYNPVLTKIFQSRNGTIWVGTYEEGLFFLDNNTNQFKCLLDQKSISALYEDRSGRLWIGTESAGVIVYDSLLNFFTQLPITVSDKVITSFEASQVVKSRKEGLWIAAVSYGLLHYDFNTRETRLIDPDNNHSNFLFADEEGKLWYSHLEYLVCYDPGNGTIKRIKHPVPDQVPSMNYGNLLKSMVEIQDKFIISSDYGQVHSYDPGTGKFKLIFETGRPIREMMTRNDTLYIAAYHTGVVVLDSSLTVLDTLYTNEERGLDQYAIFKLHYDRFDTLWAAGFGGVSRFNPQSKEFENIIDLTDPFDYVSDILEDSLGNLWFSSILGIYKYDREKHNLQFFDSNHGLPTGRIWGGEDNVTPDGSMFFGSNNGIVHFNPYLVKTNPEAPQLVFTDFIINSSSVKDSIRNMEVLEKSINYTEKIHLNYRQNSFTIKFAALNYTSPHHNQYKYKLEGLDSDWQHVGNLSQASYTNLDGGDYTFYFTGSNNDGIWNEEPRTLLIHIDPPPWKTGWAYAIYVLLVSTILIAIYYYNIRRLRLQHQLALKTKESENLLEIDKAKTNFFTNISHELRTPLTLIIDPANQLIQEKQISDKQEGLIRLILKNSQRLLYLINQILDLAKLRNTKLKLRAEETDIIAFLKPVLHAFASRAEALSLKYTISLPDTIIKLWIDKEKIEQTLINLVSNAFKFCSNGEVKVEVLEENERIMIKVHDTGIGIPDDQVDRIFENYFQVETPYTKDMAGTGIGLYLVKEYVKLHQGTVEVESEENMGTTFTVGLLKGRDHLRGDQIIEKKDISEPGAKPSEQKLSLTETRKIKDSEIMGKKSIVLVIEDNPEMTKYLVDSLSDEYKMISALNGSEGFDKTLEHNPDVVICDVMMPLVDGFTYTQKAKSDARSSHIPVILLTARNLDDDKIKGLTLGADDYMIKPFQMTELKLRIKYHLEQRKKIRVQFLRDFKFKSENEFIQSLKDQFLQKVFSYVEEFYRDDQFGVEKLSDLMGMSRKHLNHKIKTLTDQTPNELIRNFRLRKAAYLLSEKSGTVTQICYEVGFNNPSYFSKCFKEFMGKYPSDYN